MSSINSLIKAALDEIYLQNPNFLYVTNRSDVEHELQNALQNIIPNDISLSTSKPDFEAIYLQCTQALQNSDLWRDAVPSSVGQTLIRNISSGIVYLHNAIMRATQIAFMKPGTPKSSVYQIMSHFGVNPRRKVPAKIPVQITVPDHQNSFVIPKFTNFVISGVNYFNREDFIYTEFELVKNWVLVQGTQFTQSGLADGIAYEKVEIGYENFLISDEDVYVSVNDKYWKRANYQPWNAKTLDEIYFVKTLETGNIEVMFGNNIFGKQLSSEDEVEVIWFETIGKSTPNIPSSTIFDTIVNGAPLQCITTGSLFDMDDELPTDFYINMGPHMRASEGGAVKRADYPVVACKYPNVRDALFRGQAELNPGKRNWMNIVEVSILQDTTLPMTNIEWERFITYLHNNSIDRLEYVRRDIFVIPIDISAKLHCTDASMLTMIKAAEEIAIQNMNSPRRGAIGYSLFKSDVVQILEGDAVEYITDLKIEYSTGFDESTLPVDAGFDDEGNIVADYYSYVAIRNVNLTPVYTPRRSYVGRRDFNIAGS